jgi:hypothetical protein
VPSSEQDAKRSEMLAGKARACTQLAWLWERRIYGGAWADTVIEKGPDLISGIGDSETIRIAECRADYSFAIIPTWRDTRHGIRKNALMGL